MSIRLKFTKRAIEGLPLPFDKQRETYLDTDQEGAAKRDAVPGLQLTVSAKGTKSFVLCRKLNGKTKKVTVGRFPAWTVELARKKARELIVEMNQGSDPIKKRKQDRVKGVTLGEVFDEYLRVRGHTLSANTVSNYKTVVSRHLAEWVSTPLKEISRDMVASKHRGLSSTSESAANKAMRVLRALFNFANGQYEDEKGRGLFPDNPVSRLSHTRSWNKEKRRENKVRNTDIKAWFDSVLALNEREDEFAHVTSDYLLFVLLTGLRRREAAELPIENVDFDEGVFTVCHTKNGKPLTLPMSDYVREILKRRCGVSENSMVFSGQGDSGHLNDPRRVIAAVREQSGVRFTIHDLRRTFISVAESLDMSAYALKKLVNHSLGGDVTAGYIIMDVERLRRPMQQITDSILTFAGIRHGQ